MTKSYEPCLCGALDCPHCYPTTWKRNLLYQKWIDEAESLGMDPNNEDDFERYYKENIKDES